MSIACRAESVVLGYRGQPPLSLPGINFELPENKVIALLGPNGSGKSTLLSAMTGGSGAHSGSIKWNLMEKAVSQTPAPEIARYLALVSQDQLYSTSLSVSDVLRLAYLPKAGLFGKLPAGKDPAIVAMTERLGLRLLSDRPMHRLSVGERQRVFLGRALLQKPKILLLDEPTNHLDPGGSARFWKTFQEVSRSHPTTCVLSTHDLAFARENANWILALKDGQVFYSGESQDFWREPALDSLFGEKISLTPHGIHP